VTPVFKTAIVRQILVSELLSTYTSFGEHLVLSFLLACSDHGGSW
jgi:hypothetical protein